MQNNRYDILSIKGGNDKKIHLNFLTFTPKTMENTKGPSEKLLFVVAETGSRTEQIKDKGRRKDKLTGVVFKRNFSSTIQESKYTCGARFIFK